MAKIKDDYVFKLKGGEASTLESVDPFLERREPIVVFFENGRTNIKIGDGKNNYNSLPFISDTSIDINDIQGLTEILSQYEIDLENLNNKIDEIVIDKVYDPNSYNAQSGIAVAEAIETTVGRKTAGGGEIFNDYENNQAISHYSSARGSNNLAGSKAFYITALDETNLTFTLDGSVEELAVGDTYSCQLGNSYEAVGKITDIDSTTNTVTVDAFPDGYTWNETSTFRIPKKPLVGTQVIGSCAYAEGDSNSALQQAAHAEGYQNIASGKYSHVEGRSTYAGYAAHAEGQNTQALGNQSHAEGQNNLALGMESHAEGWKTAASGRASHAEGDSTYARGNASHSEGSGTKAIGGKSHAEGWGAQADGIASHAEGRGWAKGDYSHAEGSYTQARHKNSHASGNAVYTGAENQTAIGQFNKVVSNSLFVVGNGSDEGNRKNAFEVKTDGSAVLQKSAVTDDAVVRYEQIKNILADAKEYTDKEIAEVEVDLTNYYTKGEINAIVGDIETALDELHNYAQALINGGAE